MSILVLTLAGLTLSVRSVCCTVALEKCFLRSFGGISFDSQVRRCEMTSKLVTPELKRQRRRS